VTPPVYPLTIMQGDTGHWRIALWLDRDKTVPVDLDDIDVLPKIGDFVMLVEVELPNIVMLTLPASLSSLFTSNTNWSLKLTKADGEVQTIMRGPVRVVVNA